VEHWHNTPLTSVDTSVSHETAVADTLHAAGGGDGVDMREIGAENEHKLSTMTEEEILAKQKELLSVLGIYCCHFLLLRTL